MPRYRDVDSDFEECAEEVQSEEEHSQGGDETNEDEEADEVEWAYSTCEGNKKAVFVSLCQ